MDSVTYPSSTVADSTVADSTAADSTASRNMAGSSTHPKVSTTSIPDGNDEDFLTLAETAAILRVPVNTLRWWRQRGDGPRFYKIGRHLLTTIGDLRSWIDVQKRAGSGGPDAA